MSYLGTSLLENDEKSNYQFEKTRRHNGTYDDNITPILTQSATRQLVFDFSRSTFPLRCMILRYNTQNHQIRTEIFSLK